MTQLITNKRDLTTPINMSQPIIDIQDITVNYTINSQSTNSLKDLIFNNKKRKLFKQKTVLQQLNLKIYKGECVSVIGKNGAGKSTLLRTIAGIMKPEKGKVNVYGTIAPLITLNSFLDINLTGYENIALFAKLLHVPDLTTFHEFVTSFSDLSHEVLSLQVKKYSMGMCMRLVVSIALAQKYDVLLIDEALGVGDWSFNEKVIRKMKALQREGVAIVIISHMNKIISKVSTSACLLADGRVERKDAYQNILDIYQDL